ncbi:hypothetical protein [Stenotrophomonas maltophilia]|uniref:hypothetical protein n=1 Tax=Stenotrophomonas maltophilia group TaxID=995085 RepID=UPI00070E1B0D|nr:hypothetical protein [Stenotrophomonas maltophilia]KRG55883.1 hypothetical protein ARC02_07080 [Stenotrophomonas maltophilia]NNH46681.1 hypothetical protein [Stenotrophomonas maltophilia]VEE52182.1 Uncharacterised protein [Stenotrophomonas maltophilia]
MSLKPTVYQSTDPGAPALTGQADSLIALLDAILVNGYGSGAQAKAPLGWVREFQGVSKRVYRNNVVTGSGYRLRVDDSNAQYALMRGFEVMDSLDTGTGPIPTIAQWANGLLWPKSAAANSTARAWFAVGTERCFYLFINHTGVANQFSPHFAGDIVSYVPDDQHGFAVSSSGQSTYSSGFGLNRNFVTFSSDLTDTVPSSASAAMYVGRKSDGSLGAVPLISFVPLYRGFSYFVWGGMGSSTGREWPVPANGGVFGFPGFVMEGARSFRGEYPGLIAPCADLAYGDASVISGQAMVSKRFSAVPTTANSTPFAGEVLFDLGREWH